MTGFAVATDLYEIVADRILANRFCKSDHLSCTQHIIAYVETQL